MSTDLHFIVIRLHLTFRDLKYYRNLVLIPVTMHWKKTETPILNILLYIIYQVPHGLFAFSFGENLLPSDLITSHTLRATYVGKDAKYKIPIKNNSPMQTYNIMKNFMLQVTYHEGRLWILACHQSAINYCM
jgi:hypothetical protein